MLLNRFVRYDLEKNGHPRDIKLIEKSKSRYATYLHILQTVLLADAPEHVLFATFLHLARQQKFIKDEVCFLKVENDVQLADVSVVLIHLFYITMYYLEGSEFVIGRRTASDEKEGGIASINNLSI